MLTVLTTREHRLGCFGSYVLATFVMWGLTGCGYTIVGDTEQTTARKVALAIAPVSSQVREPDLERLMTAALHHALLQSPVLAPATESGSSHRLQGTIRRFRSIALSFDDQDNVLQYRLEADVSVRLIGEQAPPMLLEQDISAATEYLVSRVAANKVREDVVARQAALVRLAQQFADKCLALLTLVLL